MIQSQYIYDIIKLLLNSKEYEMLKNQAYYIKEENYEYTDSGVFISFEHEENSLKYRTTDKHLRLGGILIKSDEIDIGAEASLVINNGLIDYLEIWSYAGLYPHRNLTNYILEQPGK